MDRLETMRAFAVADAGSCRAGRIGVPLLTISRKVLRLEAISHQLSSEHRRIA